MYKSELARSSRLSSFIRIGSVVQVSKVLPKDAVDLTWQDGGKETRVLGTLDVSLHHPSPGEAFGGVCAGPECFSYRFFSASSVFCCKMHSLMRIFCVAARASIWVHC